jgi:hypothetical protein
MLELEPFRKTPSHDVYAMQASSLHRLVAKCHTTALMRSCFDAIASLSNVFGLIYHALARLHGQCVVVLDVDLHTHLHTLVTFSLFPTETCTERYPHHLSMSLDLYPKQER